MEDQEQPFAAFVLETLRHQSTKLGQWWAERAWLVAADSGEPSSADHAADIRDGAERLVQTLLGAAADGAHQNESLVKAGTTIGMEAHQRNASLHLMLREVDLLGGLILQAAEGVAADYPAGTTGHDGLAVARRIADATSRLRLAAATGYTQAIEDELRKRYRIIRHDLRNPLGTIRTAMALLTDESAPAEMRESRRVRAMVVRNTSWLDQMISEALGDAAARLRAFDTPGETPAADLPASSSPEAAASDREQPDDVARPRQRPDLETGTL